uniref:Uncharacterized protein n=1 Tax=Panagrolaimus davidi TaxID=227884 RepID=A0A914QAJ7_9BILA
MSVKSILEIEFASEVTIDESSESEIVTPPQNRKKFIQHVFSIAVFMIFVCLFIGVILNSSIEIQSINAWNDLIFVATQSIWLWFFILFCLCKIFHQKTPLNWILFSIFTAFSALFVSSHISFFEFPLIIAAFISTVLVSIVLILYGIFTKIDYTTFDGLVGDFSIASYGWYIILYIASGLHLNIPGFYRIYCILISLLRMLILLIDVQQIIGNRRLEFAQNKICRSSVIFFADIFQIFLFILASLGEFGNGNGFNILFSVRAW